MFADPEKILKQIGLQDNMIVADLGAGSGFYSIPAAEMTPNGKVYAVEVQKDFLVTIKNKANDAHLTNIEPIWGDIENTGGTKLKDEIIDRVIASNILFQVTNKQKFIDEAFRILKPEGKILLIDWSDSPDSFSLKQNIIVNKNQAREMFEKKDFVYERDIDAGAHHYGIILTKPSVALGRVSKDITRHDSAESTVARLDFTKSI